EVLKGLPRHGDRRPAPASPRSGLIYPGFAPLLPTLAWPTTPAPLIPARPPDRPAPHEEHHTPNPAQLARDDQVDSTTAARAFPPAGGSNQDGRVRIPGIVPCRSNGRGTPVPTHAGRQGLPCTKREGMGIDHRHVPCRAVTTAAQSCLRSTPDLSSRRQ